MFLYCQCQNCKEAFVDMFGEFKTDNGDIKCPKCYSTNILFNEKISKYKKLTFNYYNHYVKKYK